MLTSTLEFLGAILGSLWGIVEGVAVYAGSLLYWLHTDAPRLEGLLIGVLLAWLLSRRDKHPLLRAASAPLKLILDIIDLAWDQVVEVSLDLWDTAKGWTLGLWGWGAGKVKSGYDSLMSKLKSTKDNLE